MSLDKLSKQKARGISDISGITAVHLLPYIYMYVFIYICVLNVFSEYLMVTHENRNECSVNALFCCLPSQIGFRVRRCFS